MTVPCLVKTTGEPSEGGYWSYSADGQDVVGTLHERDTDSVQLLLGGKGQEFPIPFGEGADTQVDAGEIDAFVGAQLAANLDNAVNGLTCHPFNRQLDVSVVHEDAVAGLHRRR